MHELIVQEGAQLLIFFIPPFVATDKQLCLNGNSIMQANSVQTQGKHSKTVQEAMFASACIGISCFTAVFCVLL